MKNKINSMSLLLLFFMGMVTLSFTACSDSDSSSGGQPEITGVKILTSDTINYSYDNYYTKARAGSMLAIMGRNLGGALKVYINGQELTFNSTMNTETSLIVSIPTEEKGFKLSAFNSDVPDEIKVVTPGGTAVYSFKVTAPSPQINRVQALYPREAGDEINLFGKNLVDIEKAYITDVTAEELEETEWETIGGNHIDIPNIETVVSDHYLNATSNAYETISQLKFNLPNVPFETGLIVLECASGIAYIPYYHVPGTPVITSIPTDMPITGTDFVITGREFVQVESITYGDVTLTPDEFTVAETEDMITIPFTKKPTPGSGTTLTVTTPGGQAKVERFFDYSGLLVSFEPGAENDEGWNPHGDVMTPATSDAMPYTSDGQYYRINSVDAGNNWWGTMCYFSFYRDWGNGGAYTPFTLPGFDAIPASASTDEVYLAMEVWDNNTDFGGAQFPFIHYQIQTIGNAKSLVFQNFSDGAYLEKPLRAFDNSQPKQKWYRAVIPLSKFDGWFGMTYADVVNDGINTVRIMHMNHTASPSSVDIMLDNIRLIYVPSN